MLKQEAISAWTISGDRAAEPFLTLRLFRLPLARTRTTPWNKIITHGKDGRLLNTARESSKWNMLILLPLFSQPLVAQASTVLKRLCKLLAERKDIPYATAANWFRIKLSFSLLRSTLTCLRGSRPRVAKRTDNYEMSVSETQLERFAGFEEGTEISSSREETREWLYKNFELKMCLQWVLLISRFFSISRSLEHFCIYVFSLSPSSIRKRSTLFFLIFFWHCLFISKIIS